MNDITNHNWHEANQKYLIASLAVVREALERYADRISPKTGEDRSADPQSGTSQQALKEAADRLPTPSALETLCRTFGLSPFERDILLLCAGMELDSKFAFLTAALSGESSRGVPTFSLALSALPDPHWSALSPTAPLRYWRLIEVREGTALTLSPLRIDERILHYLAGVQHPDERLMGIIEPLQKTGDLIPSHRKVVDRIGSIWSQSPRASALPVVQLCGDEVASKRDIAAVACVKMGMNLSVISAHVIPSNAAELASLIRLWEREAVLSSSALFVDCDRFDATDAGRNFSLLRLIEWIQGAVIVATRERLRSLHHPIISIEVRKPNSREQRSVWEERLGQASINLNGKLEDIVSQFSLNSSAIHAVCSEALSGSQHPSSEVKYPEPDNPLFPNILWDTCRANARPRLDDLAQQIESSATWDDLVLPISQKQTLRDMVAHVRQRTKVYETWGFAAKNSRGLGISALFSGASGTGKTMAAEVLANELRLDLYRIDLSQVVSKYIGETEKNLRRVFDAAEEGGTVLLFDEADALFGKRSDVKDSHDRYANIEVSYLLQRMEAYRGLAIMTTNMKSAIDTAFLRRIRFIVQFPFPDAEQRAEIWRRVFPDGAPKEGVDVNKLARLNIAGGNICNIALNAAFLAAEMGDSLRMTHLLRAAHSEYAKMERPLTEAESGNWK